MLDTPWTSIDTAMLKNPPAWFREGRELWLSNGKQVYIGVYQWRQGHYPDRLIMSDYGDVSALTGWCAMELIRPAAPVKV